jgi:hypothetical protein
MYRVVFFAQKLCFLIIQSLCKAVFFDHEPHCTEVVFSGALMLRPPTNRPQDILTHTKCPQNFLSDVTISYCDTLSL